MFADSAAMPTHSKDSSSPGFTRWRRTLRRYRRSPLARRLLLAILLVSSLGALLATLAQLSLDYRRDVSQVAQELDSLQKTTAGNLAYNLWVVNPDAVNNQLADLLRLPNLRYAEVVEDDGTLYQAGRPVGETADRVSKTFKLEYRHPFTGEKLLLGTARLESTKADIKSRLFERFLVILLSQGIKTLLVAAFILFIFQWLVTRHLQRIAEQARRINYLNLREPLRLEREQEDDELTELVEAFNQMRRNLQHDLSLWERAEQQLARENASNLAALEALPEPLIRLDSRGQLSFMNTAAACWLELEAQTAQGRLLGDLLPPAPGLIAMSAERLLLDVQTSQLPVIRERVAFLASGGQVQSCKALAQPLRDEKGQYLGTLFMFWRQAA